MSNRFPVGDPPGDLRVWREGYRRYLIGKGMPSEAASDIATKVPYRVDLYPATDHDRRSSAMSDDTGSNIVQPTLGNTLTPISGSTTARMRRLLEASSEIAAEPPSGDNIVFLHSTMCQLGLPRSEVEGSVFERQCGNKALRMTAGYLWDGERFVLQPVPYGSLPRLILPRINAAAKRLGSPEISLGRSGRELLRTLGKDTSGGKKGGYTMLKRQMLALVASRLTLGFNTGERAVTRDSSPIEQIEAWQPKSDDDKEPVTVDFSKMVAYLYGENMGQEDEAWFQGNIVGKSSMQFMEHEYTLYDVTLIHEENQPAILIRIATKNAQYKNFEIGQFIRGNIWIQANIYAKSA